MLCDDMGLGKTLQVLSLVLARPSPAGWAVERLPARTDEPCPIKATLVVAPACNLEEWEREIRTHLREGAITYCTYTKQRGGDVSVERQQRDRAQAEAAAALLEEAGRPRRERKAAVRFDVAELGSAPRRSAPAARRAAADSAAAAAAAQPQQQPERLHADSEVLAVTQRAHRFVGPGGAAPPPLVDCDVVLVSFETLRDEMRSGPDDTVFSTLGFWRVVLDEAQLVANSTSAAAIMCSQLWRRHAWVATGTPINARADELQGLLTFLGLRPFADDVAWRLLLHQGYLNRAPASLARMRSLLRGIMLRRSKDDPAIAEQIRVPPLVWETRRLRLSAAEQATYHVALQALRDSHRLYARARSEGQQGALGRLMGDLTRLRQMLCHPSVINSERLAGGNNRAAVIASGERLPQAVIMARLVIDAYSKRDADAIRSLQARAVLAAFRAPPDGGVPKCATDLRDEVLAGAAEAMLRLPRAERHAVLEAAISRRERECRMYSSASTRAARLASCARGLCGLGDVSDGSVVHHEGNPLALCASLLERLERLASSTDAGRLADAEARAWPADESSMEKLKQLPRRWATLYESLAPIWGEGTPRVEGEADDDDKPARGGKRRARSGGGGGEGSGSGPGTPSLTALAERMLAGASGDRGNANGDGQSGSEAEDDGQSGEEDDVSRRPQAGQKRKHLAPPGGSVASLRRAQEMAAQAAARLRESMRSLTYMQGQQAASRAPRSSSTIDGAVSGVDAVASGGAAGSSDPPAADSAAVGSERCVICFEDRDQVDDWAITQCMHEGCWECMLTTVREHRRCPICREPLQPSQLHRAAAEKDTADEPVEADPEPASSTAGGAAATAAAASEYGTKVAALLGIVGEACAADGGKVVIFSGWTRLLRLTAEALSAHGLSNASLAGSPEAKRSALRSFRSAHGASVLLVPLFGGASGAGGGGAAGLTLTEARTAILLEPQLQPGIERQAAGRISRIGQTRETRCIRLIMENTIEPNILRWQEQRLATGTASSAAQLSIDDLNALVGSGR